MRRLSLVAAAGLVAGLVGSTGCARGPRLPDTIQRAYEGEIGPEPERAWQAIVERCRRGDTADLDPRKDDCGLAYYRRALALEQEQRYEEALAAYREVRGHSRDRVRGARAQVRAAQVLLKLGRKGEAGELLAATVREVPGEVPGEDALRALVRLRRDEDAPTLGAELDGLAEVLRPYEGAGSYALFDAARFYQDKGRAAEALARYDELARRYPKGPLLDDALFAAALLLRQGGRSAEAAERLERLQQRHESAIVVGHYHRPRLIESVLLLGQVYLHDLRQPEAAIKVLQRLPAWQPASVLCDDALLVMAQAAVQRSGRPLGERRTEACGYLLRLLRDYPDSNQRRAAMRLQAEIGCVPAPGRS
jgi:tetratricopeptide (TPR) repeat protein